MCRLRSSRPLSPASSACRKLAVVLPAAVPAKVPESLVFRVLVGCVLPRLSYVCRVCHPSVVVSRAAPAIRAIEGVAQSCFGWSDAEFSSCLPQVSSPARDGGFGLVPLEVLAPASWLDGCLAAAVSLGWAETLDDSARFWSSAPTKLAGEVRAVFKNLRDSAPAFFPSSLEGLDVGSLSSAFRRAGGGARWQAQFIEWLSSGARESFARGLEKRERETYERRLEESGGAVLEMLPPFGFSLSTETWRTAARLRSGLPVAPAFCTVSESRCALFTRDGKRCNKQLDDKGHHALCCSCGGGFTVRHDHIREVLASALRRFGCVVHTERWTHELYDEQKKKHARMDLVVYVGGRCFYLDVTCVHPFSERGVPRADGKVVQAQLEKHKRYRTVVAGVRVTQATLVPIALSSFGKVGPEASDFFSLVARCYVGRENLESEWTDPAGYLAALCSYLAVMHSAQTRIHAHTSPDHGPHRRPRPKVAAAPSSG